MNIRQKKYCGKLVPKEEKISPAQEVLNQQGEIFSCGGVYLGLNRIEVPKRDYFEFLSLPNHFKEVLVLNNQKPYRMPGRTNEEGTLHPQERPSSEDTLRRFFKESLN